jgi:hypothetical protein
MGAFLTVNNSKVLLNLLESSAPHNIRNAMGAPLVGTRLVGATRRTARTLG